ncbi:MAG: hypothetical protein QXK89_08620 [Candidatus Bathyarchaeia archaeon]
MAIKFVHQPGSSPLRGGLGPIFGQKNYPKPCLNPASQAISQPATHRKPGTLML